MRPHGRSGLAIATWEDLAACVRARSPRASSLWEFVASVVPRSVVLIVAGAREDLIAGLCSAAIEIADKRCCALGVGVVGIDCVVVGSAVLDAVAPAWSIDVHAERAEGGVEVAVGSWFRASARGTP